MGDEPEPRLEPHSVTFQALKLGLCMPPSWAPEPQFSHLCSVDNCCPQDHGEVYITSGVVHAGCTWYKNVLNLFLIVGNLDWTFLFLDNIVNLSLVTNFSTLWYRKVTLPRETWLSPSHLIDLLEIAFLFFFFWCDSDTVIFSISKIDSLCFTFLYVVIHAPL